MISIFEYQNPWRQKNYHFPKRPFIKREILNDLLKEIDHPEITTILGSRQVGKTFLMQKMIEALLTEKKIRPQQIFYFNFDELSFIPFLQSISDFLEFIQSYCPNGKKAYIFLDEIQRIMDAGLLLKKYYDLNLNIKFIISGSSSLDIRSKIKETLAGRKRVFEILPITFREFLDFNAVQLDNPLSIQIKLEKERFEKYFEEFTKFGGYPACVTAKTNYEKQIKLKEIYQSYVQKDISDYLKIENVVAFNKMVQLLALQSGQLFKLNEVSKQISLSRYFTEKYLQSLKDTYIIQIIQPLFSNKIKSTIKTPKVYFLDTGIQNSIWGNFANFNQRGDVGQLVETVVFTELLKSNIFGKIWFFRTLKGSEIDFIYQKGEQLVPIEVKFSSKRQKIIPKVFYSFSEVFGIKKGIVFTKDFLGVKKQKNIEVHFFPVWAIYKIHDLINSL